MQGSDQMVRPKISASLMCADLLDISKELKVLEESKIDYIHYDIMDGSFVNNISLGIHLFNQIREVSKLPMDVHFLTNRPSDYIEQMDIRKGDIVSIHVESDVDIGKISDYVKGRGVKFGLAIRVDTEIKELIDKCNKADVLLVMMIPAGFPGVPMAADAVDRLKAIRAAKDKVNPNIELEVDGNISFDNAKELYDNGADIFVAGSSSIYSGKGTVTNNIGVLRSSLLE